MGYTYERDQLVRLRKVVDRGIYLIEAIMKGRVSEKEMEKYKLIQPALLKAFDKLHPNKTEVKSELNVQFTISQVLDQLEDGRTIEGQAVEVIPPVQNKEQG